MMGIILIFVGGALIPALGLIWLTAPPRERTERSWTPAPRSAEVVLPQSNDETDEQAIRDHQRVAEQYHAMIDELYDFGEKIAQRAGRQS